MEIILLRMPMEPLKKRLLMMLATGLLCGALIGAGAVTQFGGNAGGGSPSLLNAVPDVRQSTDYSCGAASTQAVFSHWGIDLREGVLMQELGTSEANGTTPGSILRVAAEHGLAADMRTNMTLADLQDALSRNIAVIIVGQAWTENHSANFTWADDWVDGHYMVVIGLDAQNVYLEDPAILGARGVIPREEFLDRWHDDGGGEVGAPGVYLHMGIFIVGAAVANPPQFVHVD
jgi:predicted double-glycine peptidase